MTHLHVQLRAYPHTFGLLWTENCPHRVPKHTSKTVPSFPHSNWWVLLTFHWKNHFLDKTSKARRIKSCFVNTAYTVPKRGTKIWVVSKPPGRCLCISTKRLTHTIKGIVFHTRSRLKWPRTSVKSIRPWWHLQTSTLTFLPELWKQWHRGSNIPRATPGNQGVHRFHTRSQNRDASCDTKVRFHTTLAKSWQSPLAALAPAARPTEQSGGTLHPQC